jgi:glycosyltransferase involved in cell wall biosynthesis
MKVLHVIATLHRGGIEQLVLEMGRARLSEEMAVCSLSEVGPLAKQFATRGVRVVTCAYHSPRLHRFVLSLAKLIRRLKPDVVHSHVGSFTLWVAAASRLAGVKRIVSTYHSTYVYQPAWRHQIYLTVAAGLVGAQIGVSQSVCRWFADRYNLKNMQCIYNGIAMPPNTNEEARARARKALGIPLDVFVVGTVGNFTAAKDYPTFFNVAHDVIRSAARPVIVLVIGGGAENTDAGQRIARLQLGSSVRLLGTRSDVAALLPAMDVFLSTSTREGFALSIIEAQAAGLPVVASRIGPNQEAVEEGHGGMLVTPGAVKEYAASVRHLMRDPQRARVIGSAGRERVLQAFSIEKTIALYREVYNGLS